MSNPRNIITLYLPAFLLIIQLTTSLYASAAETGEKAATNDKFDGDILTLRVTISSFKKVGDVSKKNYCAPKGAKISVTKDQGAEISLRFISVPMETDVFSDKKDSKFVTCEEKDRVDSSTQYEIDKSELTQYDYKRAGVTFGALMVPFKFYMGGDKRISASSTLAPYVGFSNSSLFGLTWTPIISAGLGLVPIADPTTDQTETKAAFSTSVGVLLTSSKSEAFSAGILFGKDFLSKKDREIDPTVSKAWFAFYVGYSM